MDIHRCRFVPYPASGGINCVAFSHSRVKSQKAPVRLAVGRAGGDVEIWNPLNGLWHQEKILHGGKDRSIDGLVWVNEPDLVLPDGKTIQGRSRLFSIGYTSTVTEWSLEKGQPKKQATGMHGDIWCIGIQPLDDNSKTGSKIKTNGAVNTARKLVAGTIDGSLVLYSIDDDDLQFDRVLVKSTSKKTKMVSITFQTRNTVVVGCSDGAIRVYDMRNGTLIRKMTLGSDLAGGSKDVIVWSVKCLNDRDIVSGDSTGEVCIWDGKTYTLAQRIKSHKQDVLSLAVSADGSAIFSGGMDRRSILYRKTSGSRWTKVWHRRYHSHDVKTMASFEGNGMSVVVTGGWLNHTSHRSLLIILIGPDATPIIMPLQQAGKENHRVLSHLPQQVPLRSAARGRLMIGFWNREVHVWRLQKAVKDMVTFSDVEWDVAKNRKLLARILIKGEGNITSATISEDGSLIVVSTTSDIKAFHLAPRSATKPDEIKISKVDIPTSTAGHGATNVKISPDGNWICLIQEGTRVALLRVLPDADSNGRPAIHPRAIKLNRVKRNISKYDTLGGLGQYDRTINQIAFSSDTKMLAGSDLGGYIDTWILRDPKSMLQHGTNGRADDASSSEDSSSESEDESYNEALGGALWAVNPNGSQLPKLNSALTVLSFSDHVPSEKRAMKSGHDNGEIDDYILLAVTANRSVFTFHPNHGILSPWTRRNPTAKFPVEYRNVRDLVKGALWCGDRVWLYGHRWLGMIDMSVDIVEAEENSALVQYDNAQQNPKKRKRGKDTGAGNKMKHGEGGGPTKVIRVVGENVRDLSLDKPAPDPMDTDATSHPGDSDNDDESEEELRGELALRRRVETQNETKNSLGGYGGDGSQGMGFWHTFKYRDIVGIVPLESEQDDQDGDDLVSPFMNGATRKTLEVALVERPLWDVDMPNRYLAEGEVER